MGARFFVGGLNRFASADTIIPDPANPQSYNRYSYTVNNPLRYVDDNGHLFWDVIDVLSFGWSAYEFYHEPTWENAGWLALDAVSLLPVLPSIGTVRHGADLLSHGDEALDVARSLDNVLDARHATVNADFAQSVIKNIDPGRFDPRSRFGAAFYASQQGGTAVAEVLAHGGDASHLIRFELDLSKARVLDLSDAKVAEAWGYVKDVDAISDHQNIAARAIEEGYNVIVFESFQGPGLNYALLNSSVNPFDWKEWLIPQMISPVP